MVYGEREVGHWDKQEEQCRRLLQQFLILSLEYSVLLDDDVWLVDVLRRFAFRRDQADHKPRRVAGEKGTKVFESESDGAHNLLLQS